MKVIKNENPVMFDVDETLIKHRDDDATKFDLSIQDPHTGTWHKVTKHKRHIDYLKKSYGRGRVVVVWSANGYDWACEVVKRLKLTKYVHIVMTKPTVYFDDVPADSFMNRVYINQKD